MGRKRKALPLPLVNWRSRWLTVGHGDKLHRVAEARWKNVEAYDGSLVEADGVAVCGARGEMRMPGILARMGEYRCARCCDALGIPRGWGAPYNVFEDWRQDA